MCCGKLTIAVTTMQEHHNNNKIEFHNHNEYPLLCKEAELPALSLGRFFDCRKCNILVITQALVLCLIYTLALGHRSYIDINALLPVS